MKLLDVNILLYVVNTDAAHHIGVRRWWETAIDGDETIALPWVTLLGFLRIATNPKIFPQPLTPADAAARVTGWLSLGNVRAVGEKDRHWDLLRELLADAGTAGNLTTDAHLAALAIGHGATLVSCDSDFARFRGLRWQNPLAH